MTKPSVKVGDRFLTNEGYQVEVIEYKNKCNVSVKFHDRFGYVKNVRASELKTGKVKNPFHKSVYGVGMVGVGRHPVSINGKLTAVYTAWNNMLKRCYCKDALTKNPTYSDSYVCDGWHNFQNFAEWYCDQKNPDNNYHIDKDLRVLGNKVYSPETCSLLPREINNLLTDRRNARGMYPQGVYKEYGKYKSQINLLGKRKFLGYFETPEEAHSVYRESKRQYVREQAEKYKEVLHPEVYRNLVCWELSELEKVS